MIHTLFTKGWAFPLFILSMFCVSLACNTITKGVPGESYPQELTVEKNVVYGPGTFVFADPKAGLSDLSSYTASLKLSFDGTRDGTAEKWSKTYTMLTTKEPAARHLTVEQGGDTFNENMLFMAELDGADYEKHVGSTCEITAIQEGNSLADRFEPALFLDAVIGAEEAVSDKVNDVAANHYTFDQRALGEDGVTESTGELWVASEGGYLVRYLLTRKAKADYFGEGVEGTLTLDYELTDVNNKDNVVVLPDDCPPGFVDAPLLPDASNTSNIPGILAYDTSSSIADAAAFYEKGIPDLGWKAQDQPAITDTIAVLTFQQEDKTMLIVIKTKDTKTNVRIMESYLISTLQ